MADKKTEKPAPVVVVDKRLSDRMIARGAISRADFEKQLQALPDLADKAEVMAPADYGHDA
jgi:hypothetical protein